MEIVGRWKGFATQAILGQTPFREQEPGMIGDLVFNSDGTCYSEKLNNIAGMQRFDYDYIYNSNTKAYEIYSNNFGNKMLFAEVKLAVDGLIWRFADDLPVELSGTCIFYKKA